MDRNTWILIGVAAVAFLAFVLFGSAQEGSSIGGGSGILGLFRGGGERVADDVAAGSAEPGGMAPAGPRAVERRKAARAEAKRALKSRARPGGRPDPALLARMQAGGGGLVATGPAQTPRAGIVQQSFRRRSAADPIGVGAGGGSGGSGQDAGDDSGGTGGDDRISCGSPRVQKTVVDLQKSPNMRAAFDVPSRSQLIAKGLGERFSIGDAPAFVILIINPKSTGGSASAGAIFDDRFLVLIKGQCIPDRQYVKSLLRQ